MSPGSDTSSAAPLGCSTHCPQSVPISVVVVAAGNIGPHRRAWWRNPWRMVMVAGEGDAPTNHPSPGYSHEEG